MADLPTIELKIDQIIENLGSAGQKTVAPIVDRIQRIEEAIFGGAGVGLIISSASIATIIRSTNFESGVSGWQIQKSGDVEFQNGIFRGDITADSGFFSGLVYVGDAPDRIVLDGPNKQVRSEDFDTGIEGWAINGDGTVEFQSAVLRGDITADSGRFWGTVHVGASPGFRTVIDGAAGSIHSEGYIANTSGWNINHDGSAEFRDVVIRGSIKASVFTYNETNAIAGSQFILPSAGTLRAAATVAGSFNIDITDPESGHVRLFNVGDKIRIQDGAVGSTWGTVASYIDLTTFYRYTITYASGSSPVTYQKGTVVLDYGVSGDGGILMNADGATGPFISVFTHAGSPWAATTERVRVGNLNGWGPFITDVFGFALGDFSGGSYMYFDPGTQNTKLVNGGGSVVMDKDGILIAQGISDVNKIRWANSGTKLTEFWTDYTAGSDVGHELFILDRGDTVTHKLRVNVKNKTGALGSTFNMNAGVTGTSAFNEWLIRNASNVTTRFVVDDNRLRFTYNGNTGLGLTTDTASPLFEVVLRNTTTQIGKLSLDSGSFKYSVNGTDEVIMTSSGKIQPRQVQMPTGGTIDEFSIDGTMAGNSDTAVPTEKAIKTYVDAHANASAAVHGLPASVNVLGNRNAAGEFVQRGTNGMTSASTNITVALSNTTNSPTFPVAFSATPIVVATGQDRAAATTGVASVSTSGFSWRFFTNTTGSVTVTVGYIAIGS